MSLTTKIARKLRQQSLSRLSLAQLQTRLAARRGAVILCYHALDDALDAYPYRTRATALDAQLTFVRDACDILPLTEVVGLLRAGTLPTRDRPVAAICFDDGYACNATQGTAVLDRLDLPATLFAPRDLIHSPGPTYMSEATLRTLSTHPLWSIGAHGITHNVLTGFHPADVQAELEQSRHWLADVLGHAPQGFAYPQGQLCPAIRDATARLYDHAMATDTRAINGFDPHQIRRFCPDQRHDDLACFGRDLLMAPIDDGTH